MKFSRWLFRIAGIYGLLVLVPHYFMEEHISQDHPPPIGHAEFFYGFLGVAIAWQVGFLVIAHHPQRFRPMILPAVLEKFSFAAAAIVLFCQQRLAPPMFAAGMIDLVLGVLFLVAWRRLSAK